LKKYLMCTIAFFFLFMLYCNKESTAPEDQNKLWEVFQIGPDYIPLFAAFMADNNNMTVVGELGSIYTTHDQGNNWTKANTGIEDGLFDVFFWDKWNGIVVGYGGTILKTINGGTTWQTKYCPTEKELSGISFSDEVGFAVGASVILKSEDKGETWSKVWYAENYGDRVSLRAVTLLDKNIGFTVGDGGSIWRTDDGGLHWQKQTSNVNQRLTDIFFINENDGFIVGGWGTLLKTSDGGETWLKLEDVTTVDLGGVCFVDDQHGIIVGRMGKTYYTSDKGDTWIENDTSEDIMLLDVDFNDASNGIIAADKCAVMITTEGGW